MTISHTTLGIFALFKQKKTKKKQWLLVLNVWIHEPSWFSRSSTVLSLRSLSLCGLGGITEENTSKTEQMNK